MKLRESKRRQEPRLDTKRAAVEVDQPQDEIVRAEEIEIGLRRGTSPDKSHPRPLQRHLHIDETVILAGEAAYCPEQIQRIRGMLQDMAQQNETIAPSLQILFAGDSRDAR